MVLLVSVVFLTIGFSFICSIWEASLYSVPPGRVELLRREGSSRGVRLAMLRENVDRPVSAILTLNTIAHTAGATLAGSLVAVHLGAEHLTVFSVSFVLAILVFSEIIPKTIGFVHANSLAPLFAWPIQILIWVLYPAVIMSDWITRLLKPSKKDAFPTEDDILSVASLGVRSGGILPVEEKWLTNVLKLNDVEAKDMMTPRSEIMSLDADTRLGDLRGEAGGWNHAHVILTNGGDLDDVAGEVLRREVVAALSEDKFDLKLSDLMRPASITPPTKRGHSLLKEMVALRRHLFIVADEHGKTLGLVTLEDVIEQMLGEEIEDG